MAVNFLIVVGVLFFIFGQGSSADSAKSDTLASAGDAKEVVNPLDSLSSSEIAATAAQLAALPEATAVVNQADSDEAQLHMVAAGDNLITKPQVVESNYFSNKDIKTYIVKSGDTLASVAKKFGLSDDTLRWSNDLSSNSLKKGQKLLIPPVNGIVYTVKKGDTIDNLADKYNASKEKLVAYNDAELKGIKVGERIIIPGGSIVTTPSPIVGHYGSWTASYGHNGYDYGYCTWYVANQISMPANWGNASSWAYYAGRTPGWHVSPTPTVGSIAQRSWGYGGAGHVAIVDAVKGNKIKITDMNGIAGWGQVGTAWESISNFQHFISK